MSILLSCPSCTTRYRANPDAIGDNGRRVRCASCGHTWTAELEQPVDLPELETITADDEPAEFAQEPPKPHEAFRTREAVKRRTMSAAAAGGAWGGLVAACAVVMIAASIFKVDVVTMWPRASSAYAAMGTEVNAYGFSVGELQITRESQHGVPLVVIEGDVRNFDRRRRDVPNLRAMLVDEHGISVLEWSIPIPGGPVSAGETRAFRTVVSDPPPNAVEAEVILVAGNAAPSNGVQHAPDEHDHGVGEGHDAAAAQSEGVEEQPASEQVEASTHH
jgi:predicted Zn finger-like uncharacterized protein